MIFVLDDSEAMLQALEVMLSEFGSVRTSTLWSELASDVMKAKGESVLVCDLHMPQFPGAEFCKIVRKYNTAIRIVIFTTTPAEAPPGLADEVVNKLPDGMARLREVVARLRKESDLQAVEDEQ